MGIPHSLCSESTKRLKEREQAFGLGGAHGKDQNINPAVYGLRRWKRPPANGRKRFRSEGEKLVSSDGVRV